MKKTRIKAGIIATIFILASVQAGVVKVYAAAPEGRLPAVDIGSTPWVTEDIGKYVSVESDIKEIVENELNERLQTNMNSYIDSFLQNYPEYTPAKDSLVSNNDYVDVSIDAYIDGSEEPNISIDNFITRVGSGDLPDELEVMFPKRKVGSTIDIYLSGNQSPLFEKTLFKVKINSIVDTKFYTTETLTENYVINTLKCSSVEEFKEKLGFELSATMSGVKREESIDIISKHITSQVPVKLVAQFADQHRQLIIRQVFNGDDVLYRESIPALENMSVAEYENNIFEEFKTTTPYIIALYKIAQDEDICPMGSQYISYLDALKISGGFERYTELFSYYDTTYESGSNYLKRQFMLQAAEKLLTENSIKNLCSSVIIHEGESFDYSVPYNRGFKSYMGYNTITSPASDQYKLQQKATTSYNGIRMVDGRYCIAVGTHFGTRIGQYIDLVLANGTVINCIRGDVKADAHTDTNNIFTTANGCCSEFIIDPNVLMNKIKLSGNMSNLYEDWDSPVVSIKVYDTIADFK